MRVCHRSDLGCGVSDADILGLTFDPTGMNAPQLAPLMDQPGSSEIDFGRRGRIYAFG
jgi:hypothetical protein